MTQDLLYGLIDGLVKFATDLLIPFMGWAFLVAVVFRLLVFYTIRRELWFAREFHKRIDNFIDDDDRHTHPKGWEHVQGSDVIALWWAIPIFAFCCFFATMCYTESVDAAREAREQARSR